MKDALGAAEGGMATAAKMAMIGPADPRTLRAEIMALYKRDDVRKENLNLSGAADDYRQAGTCC